MPPKLEPMNNCCKKCKLSGIEHYCHCHQDKQEVKDTKGWEERFNQFMETLPSHVGETPHKLLKDFIHSLLLSQKKDLVEKVKSLEGNLAGEEGSAEYDQALSNVLFLLKSND